MSYMAHFGWLWRMYPDDARNEVALARLTGEGPISALGRLAYDLGWSHRIDGRTGGWYHREMPVDPMSALFHGKPQPFVSGSTHADLEHTNRRKRRWKRMRSHDAAWLAALREKKRICEAKRRARLRGEN